MCSPKILLLVFVVACIFFHYRSFSPCWPLLADREHFSFSYRRYGIFMFFFFNKIRHLFFTRSSSFSVIHVSANIEKLRWKRLDFVVVFSKSPCNHAISRQKHLELPVVLYLLILSYSSLVFLWCGLTVFRAYGHVSTKISRMGGLRQFLR